METTINEVALELSKCTTHTYDDLMRLKSKFDLDDERF